MLKIMYVHTIYAFMTFALAYLLLLLSCKCHWQARLGSMFSHDYFIVSFSCLLLYWAGVFFLSRLGPICKNCSPIHDWIITMFCFSFSLVWEKFYINLFSDRSMLEIDYIHFQFCYRSRGLLFEVVLAFSKSWILEKDEMVLIFLLYFIFW